MQILYDRGGAFAFARMSLFPLIRLFAVLALIAATHFFVPEAHAQLTQQGAKIAAPSDATGSPQFGASVALSADGNTVLVGGPYNGGSEADGGPGAAWVYVRDNNGTWTEQARLLSGDPNVSEFGFAVALSANGNLAVIGAPGISGTSRGAWVFTRSGSTWSAGLPLVLPASADSVIADAISGDGSTIIIGARPTTVVDLGAASVFVSDGMGGWTQQGGVLQPSDSVGSSTPSFGRSVALSFDGNFAILGGPNDDTDAGGAGAAWVFARNAGAWSQQQKLIGTGAVGAARQGASVALSSDATRAFIGGYADDQDTDDSSGAVWVFTRSGTTWTQEGNKIKPADGLGFPGMGWALAASTGGQTFAAGGPTDGATGATFVFDRVAGTWSQRQGKLIGDNATFPRQGGAVALSADANTVAAGGPGDNGGQGAVWIFAQKPAISSITPNQGVTAGSTTVTIAGTGFTGASSLKFGGIDAATMFILDPATIIASTPAHAAGSVTVAITNSIGTTSVGGAYTYSDGPYLKSVSPGTGPDSGGTQVVLQGERFNTVTGVQFGGINATSFHVDTPTQMTAVTPPHAAGPVDILLASTGDSDVLTGGFTYFALPVITALSPNSDYVTGGAQVTITGTGFSGASAVTFGGTASSFTLDAATQITATAPAHAAGVVSVVVTTPNGPSASSAATNFRYQAAPTATSLFKFKGGKKDIGFPLGWLIADKAGNLYGVGSRGGPHGVGGVFMLSPPKAPATAWTRTVLHLFDAKSGAPTGGLAADTEGRLYGTADAGNGGLVYRLTPPAKSARPAWTYDVLHSFGPRRDGHSPYGGVILDDGGNIYGTTRFGGASDAGVIYSLKPTPTPPWSFRKLYTFRGKPDGASPQSRLQIDADGEVLGTTSKGGKFDHGAVFRYRPAVRGTPEKFTIGYSFIDAKDNFGPSLGGLALASTGKVYGTAGGSVFELTPKTPSSPTFTQTADFDPLAALGGYFVPYSVTLGKKGVLFGTTMLGGQFNTGLLFKAEPPAAGQASWRLRTVHTFSTSDPLGYNPNSDLLFLKKVIYGMTARGGGPGCGAEGCGAVFTIKE